MLGEIFRHVGKPPATMQYPFVKEEAPEEFRGRIDFISEKCIGCNMCVRDCPADALKINKIGEEKIYEAVFYLDECIYCAQCVLSCPKDALVATKDYELAALSRTNLLLVFPAKAKPVKEAAPPAGG